MRLYPLSALEGIPPPVNPAPLSVAASSVERVGEDSGISNVGVDDGVKASPGVTDATGRPLKDANAKVGPPIVETAVATGEVTAAGKNPFSLTDTRTHMRIYVYAQVWVSREEKCVYG